MDAQLVETQVKLDEVAVEKIDKELEKRFKEVAHKWDKIRQHLEQLAENDENLAYTLLSLLNEWKSAEDLFIDKGGEAIGIFWSVVTKGNYLQLPSLIEKANKAIEKARKFEGVDLEGVETNLAIAEEPKNRIGYRVWAAIEAEKLALDFRLSHLIVEVRQLIDWVSSNLDEANLDDAKNHLQIAEDERNGAPKRLWAAYKARDLIYTERSRVYRTWKQKRADQEKAAEEKRQRLVEEEKAHHARQVENARRAHEQTLAATDRAVATFDTSRAPAGPTLGIAEAEREAAEAVKSSKASGKRKHDNNNNGRGERPKTKRRRG